MSNAKSLFGNSLADTNNVSPCKSKDDQAETLLPEKYDWREAFPECVQNATSQGNCSASYATATISVV